MRIYLDNNATTQIHPEVLELYLHELRFGYGNASSIHDEGQHARRRLEDGREKVAGLIGASAREVVFTSGGTEADNAAVFGVARGVGGSMHIVTTAIEHPAVLEPIRQLELQGAEVTLVGCDRNGVVDPDAVIDAFRPATRLVALMLANNETGAIQPAAEVGRVTRARGIHFHCDAVQAAGRIPIDVEELHADTVALSGHKMHAPKGIGALWVRRGITLDPLIVGGAQERRRRAGTENVPLAVAFGRAAALAGTELEASAAMERRRDRFETELIRRFPDAVINAGAAPRVGNTSNVRFTGADAESLVIALDLGGVAVSTGSACSSGRVEPSHVLIAMGLSVEDANSSVRFSLSRFTTDEEIDRLIALLDGIVSKHRRATGMRSHADAQLDA